MKILYHHRIRSKDGQYVHVEELTNALRARGHEIIFAGPEAVEEGEFGAEAGLVASLKKYFPKALYEGLEYAYARHAFRRLEAAYKTHRPDVLYERYNLFFPAGLWLKRKYGLPFLLEVNAPLAEERARYGGLALKRLAARTDTACWTGADRVLPVTGVLANHLRQAGVRDENIEIIPNGIDLARFPYPVDVSAAKERLGLAGKTVLGFTGFMREWHRLERVLDAMAAADRPALHFLAVGDGPARQSLLDEAARRGLGDQVTVTGVIGRDRVAGYATAFDIALQPDVVAYASPLKLFEYMGLGKAIVAPATHNIREVLTDGENALLFDADLPETFTHAINRLLAEPARRETLGIAARRHIEQAPFTWAHNARRVEALFVDLLKAI